MNSPLPNPRCFKITGREFNQVWPESPAVQGFLNIEIKGKNLNMLCSVLPQYIMAEDHSYDGNFINSIIELRGSEKLCHNKILKHFASAIWTNFVTQIHIISQ